MVDNNRADTRPRLGRGLAALLNAQGPDNAEQNIAKGVVQAPIDLLRPNPRNPRRRFDSTELDELAESIKERGILQPVLVRSVPEAAGSYEIIAGERRWRAAQRAGKHEIPVLIIEAEDRDALEIAIIENIQRADLNPLEEASGYAQLIETYKYSHIDVARVVGRSRSHVANTLRLTKLPDYTQTLLADGKISAGHARALLSVSEPDAIADKIVGQGLTVRDVERIGQRSENRRPRDPVLGSPIHPDTTAYQNRLGLALGTTVRITHTGERGEIRISFRDFDQLEDFCQRLTATRTDQ